MVRKLGFLSNENIRGENLMGFEDDELEVIANATGSETEDAANEIEKNEEMLSQSDETSNALLKAGEAIDDVEIPKTAAESIRILSECLMRQVGMHNAIKNYGMESANTATNNTSSLGNKLKEWAKKIWQAVLNVAQNAANWVKDFFEKLISEAARIKREADSLAATAEGYIGKTPKPGTKIEKTKLAEKLCFEAKIADGKTFAALFTKTMDSYIDITKKSAGEDAVIKLLEGTSSILAGADQGADKLSNTIKEVTTINFSGNETSIPGESNAAGMRLLASDTLIGDKKIFLCDFKDTATTQERLENFARIKLSVEDAVHKKEIEEQDITPMNPADCKKVCEKVSELAQIFMNIKANVSKLENVQKKIANEAKRLTNTSDDNDENKKFYEASARLARAMLGISTNGLSSLRSYGINVSRSALEFSKKSLSILNKENS